MNRRLRLLFGKKRVCRARLAPPLRANGLLIKNGAPRRTYGGDGWQFVHRVAGQAFMADLRRAAPSITDPQHFAQRAQRR